MCRDIEMIESIGIIEEIGNIGVTVTTIINSHAKQNHNSFNEPSLNAAVSRLA